MRPALATSMTGVVQGSPQLHIATLRYRLYRTDGQCAHVLDARGKAQLSVPTAARRRRARSQERAGTEHGNVDSRRDTSCRGTFRSLLAIAPARHLREDDPRAGRVRLWPPRWAVRRAQPTPDIRAHRGLLRYSGEELSLTTTQTTQTGPVRRARGRSRQLGPVSTCAEMVQLTS
jgi:hypothetical protein